MPSKAIFQLEVTSIQVIAYPDCRFSYVIKQNSYDCVFLGMGIGMQCIEDHYMEYYVEWLDYAIENMQANYTCGFQGSNLTTCTGDSNEESNPSPRINQTESTSTSSYLFSFWCFFCNALPVLSFFVTHRNYFV